MGDPLPNPFLDPPASNWDSTPHSAMAEFACAYYNNPEQYGGLKAADLIHPDWMESGEDFLDKTNAVSCPELYQFILDTGIHIPSMLLVRHFYDFILRPQYNSKEVNEGRKRLIKIILSRFSHRFALIPAPVMFFLLCSNGVDLDLDISKMVWEYCPQLDNQDFLNSEIAAPYNLLQTAASYIDNSNAYVPNLKTDGPRRDPILLALHTSLDLFRFLVESYNISLVPLYNQIGPLINSKDEIGRINEIPLFLQFSVPGGMPKSSETIKWYLYFLKDIFLGDAITLGDYQHCIWQLTFDKLSFNPINSVGYLEFLGNDYFSDFSVEQINIVFDTLLKSFGSSTFASFNNDLSFLSLFFSFQSIRSKLTTRHWKYFIRKSCPFFIPELVQTFLGPSGLTMEQVWSNHCYTTPVDTKYSNYENTSEADGDDAIFNLKNLLFVTKPNQLSRSSGSFNHNPHVGWSLDKLHAFLNWLSFQPGTCEQLIKMAQSHTFLVEGPLVPELEGSTQQLLCFILCSFSTSELLDPSAGLQPQPSQQPQKPQSWIKALIINAPIDYLSVKFTPRMINDFKSIPILQYLTGLLVPSIGSRYVKKEHGSLGLCHLVVLLSSSNDPDNPPEWEDEDGAEDDDVGDEDNEDWDEGEDGSENEDYEELNPNLYSNHIVLEDIIQSVVERLLVDDVQG